LAFKRHLTGSGGFKRHTFELSVAAWVYGFWVCYLDEEATVLLGRLCIFHLPWDVDARPGDAQEGDFGRFDLVQRRQIPWGSTRLGLEARVLAALCDPDLEAHFKNIHLAGASCRSQQQEWCGEGGNDCNYTMGCKWAGGIHCCNDRKETPRPFSCASHETQLAVNCCVMESGWTLDPELCDASCFVDCAGMHFCLHPGPQTGEQEEARARAGGQR